MTTLQALCVDKIEQAFVTAEQYFGRTFDRVPVTFSNRMTHTAGKAIYVHRQLTGEYIGKEIRLSNKLLENEGEAFVERTPGHEAAHIIVYALHGASATGHGSAWQKVMRVIGLEPSRCHSYETPAKKTLAYRAKCGTEKQLTLIRHNKLQRGKVGWYRWGDGVKVYKDDFCG